MHTTELFPATRAHALQRLAAFAPHAGRDYSENRNVDEGPGRRSHVSMLSPYLRHRLITEREVVATVLAQHSLAGAEKYVQEVLWRTYWKGWLEMRPAVWHRFVAERDAVRDSFRGAKLLKSAVSGATGIDGFDDWARELVETGYLHNHARMWFASIWIFTLELPWTLGADFFLRHLVDADPASNTLSWRWVAGLQTVGKTYLATAENIARYTQGRFAPKGLAVTAQPLVEPPIPSPLHLQERVEHNPRTPALLVVTPEDLHPETVFVPDSRFNGALIFSATDIGAPQSQAFGAAAAADTTARVKAHFGSPVQNIATLDPEVLLAASRDAGVGTIVTPYAPTGSIAHSLSVAAATLKAEGVQLIQTKRTWDARLWPFATKGFFAFKQHIPAVLADEA